MACNCSCKLWFSSSATCNNAFNPSFFDWRIWLSSWSSSNHDCFGDLAILSFNTCNRNQACSDTTWSEPEIDKFPIIGWLCHSFKRVSYRYFYLSNLQLKVKLKSYALKFEVNEISLVFLMCDMSFLYLTSYVRKFMEKQHKNIIHIIYMTLPLITEFNRCGLPLRVMLQSLIVLFSSL